MGSLLVQSDGRETSAALEDIRFMSDWNMYDNLFEGHNNNCNNSKRVVNTVSL